ncbi:phage integrase, N-terminal SAM-like protein [Delftia sp. Cs1-4]|nr:phage integrase, N-terminal SAM-like protein [Delftia sp. Cs1-4]
MNADTPSPDRPRRRSRRAKKTSRRHPGRRHLDWAGLSAADVLARHPPGSTPPEDVLEILLDLFNEQHTAMLKSVSHKTRHDRAVFLRRFLRDLHAKAGFATIPDPRNLGGRHIQAMVDLWRKDRLAAATIQTYLSFLRGLAQWIGKPGLVRKPGAYGMDMQEYQRHEVAQRDRSWTGAGIDIEPLIEEVCAYDRHVGAALRLIRAFGLRRKEAVMMRPHACVVPFSATRLPQERKKAESYLWVCQGSKGGRPRFVAIATEPQHQALAYAQSVAVGIDAHLSNPKRDLKQNLNHFSYVMRRFGLSLKERGATGHGLRHEVFVEVWVGATGTQPPVRGGALPPKEVREAARQDIAELAGHARKRAAGAYIGSVRAQRPAGAPPGTGAANDERAVDQAAARRP